MRIILERGIGLKMAIRVGRRGRVTASSPTNEESTAVSTVAMEENDVAGVEVLLLDVSTPAFGQDITLTTVPIGVSESPWLTFLVLKAEEKSFFNRVCGGSRQREVSLGVLFWDDQAVEFSDVTWG